MNISRAFHGCAFYDSLAGVDAGLRHSLFSTLVSSVDNDNDMASPEENFEVAIYALLHDNDLFENIAGSALIAHAQGIPAGDFLCAKCLLEHAEFSDEIYSITPGVTVPDFEGAKEVMRRLADEGYHDAAIEWACHSNDTSALLEAADLALKLNWPYAQARVCIQLGVHGLKDEAAIIAANLNADGIFEDVLCKLDQALHPSKWQMM